MCVCVCVCVCITTSSLNHDILLVLKISEFNLTVELHLRFFLKLAQLLKTT